MNRSQIADRLAGWMGLIKSSARDAVDAVFETIGKALARNEDVRTAGFGTFMTMSRPAPSGRNPYGHRNLQWQGEARRATSARAADSWWWGARRRLRGYRHGEHEAGRVLQSARGATACAGDRSQPESRNGSTRQPSGTERPDHSSRS